MAGFDLKEGRYINRILDEDEMWAVFTYVFSSKSRNDSTYKYGFLKSILDNIYNVDKDLTLTFDQLFSKFGEIYWNLILKHGLRQKAVTKDNRNTYLEQTLHSIVEKYSIIEPIPYESLTPAMMDDYSHQVKMKCKKYVVGALYEDTKRLFYSFSKKEEWLKFNPYMYEFVCKHKVILEKANYYEWARFLEKVNEQNSTFQLLNKIDESAKRNDLSTYRKILFEEFEARECFYCGKKLHKDSDRMDVDHFVPWSFVKDDNIWNLVLTCPSCNRRKRDRIPSEKFLSDLLARNDIIMEKHADFMEGYDRKKLVELYKWAIVNGFNSVWPESNGDNKIK